MKPARTKTADADALDDITETLKRVPKARLGVVRDLVHALASPPTMNGKRKTRTQKKVSLLDTPLCGIWADRDDITDSQTFARELRMKMEARGDRTRCFTRRLSCSITLFKYLLVLTVSFAGRIPSLWSSSTASYEAA